MIDFVKVCITDPQVIQRILKDEKFTFLSQFEERTADLIPFPAIANWNEWMIEVKSSAYMLIMGSLHKYYSGGINHNDFSMNDLKASVARFGIDFHVDPEDVDIQNLEFGVNLETKFHPDIALRRIHAFKNRMPNTPIQSIRGHMVNFDFDKYYVLKAYDKTTQKCLKANILRLEIKALKSRLISDCQIRVLADLTIQENIIKLGEKLVSYLKYLVFLSSSNKCNTGHPTCGG